MLRRNTLRHCALRQWPAIQPGLQLFKSVQAARTVFQIAGALLFVMRNFPSLNGPSLIRCNCGAQDTFYVGDMKGASIVPERP